MRKDKELQYSLTTWIEDIIKHQNVNRIFAYMTSDDSCMCEDCNRVKLEYSYLDEITLNAIEAKNVDLVNFCYSIGGKYLGDDYMEDIDHKDQLDILKWLHLNLTIDNVQKLHLEINNYLKSDYEKKYNAVLMKLNG